MSKLGFCIHPEKSVFEPTQELTFLGYVLNSKEFTVKPTQKKICKLKEQIVELLQTKRPTIRSAASILGLMNDMCKAVDYGLSHVKFLEGDKIRSLKFAGAAQFEGRFQLSKLGKRDLNWWLENVAWRSRLIRPVAPLLEITTDASLEGWGAVFQDKKTGGRWGLEEKDFHINVLELKAVELGLKTFFNNKEAVEIKVISDNTTTVAYINHMGGTKSKECNAVAHDIWECCETREIWLVATHLPGIENTEADHESRNFSENTEWALNKELFEEICLKWGRPNIDLEREDAGITHA